MRFPNIFMLIFSFLALSGCVQGEIETNSEAPETEEWTNEWSHDLMETNTRYILVRVAAPSNEPAVVDLNFNYFVTLNESPLDDLNEATNLRPGHCGGLVAGSDNQTSLIPGQSPFVKIDAPVIDEVVVNSFPLEHTANHNQQVWLNIGAGEFIDVLAWVDGFKENVQTNENTGTLTFVSQDLFSIRQLPADGVCLTTPADFEKSDYTTIAGRYEASLANQLPSGANHFGFLSLGSDESIDARIEGPNGTIAHWTSDVRGWFNLTEKVDRVQIELSSSSTPGTIVQWISVADEANISITGHDKIAIE